MAVASTASSAAARPYHQKRGGAPARVVAGLGQALVEHALQAEDDVLRGLPAQLGRLREARANQVVEAGRRRDTCGGQRGRLRLEDLRDEARLGGRLEGAVARDHLVEHGAEREDVAARIGLVPFELLGRHVLQRAGDGARRAEIGCLVVRVGLRRGQLGPCLREAEVEQLRAALREDDVRRA